MSIKLSNHFIARRLHSLSGVIPISAFLLEHFYTNFHAVAGSKSFNQAIESLHQLLPGILLPAAEISLIGLPIAFHAIYGLYIAYGMKNNTFQYSHGDNWRYLFQRITGIFLVLFILAHVATMRFGVGFIDVANHANQGFEIVHHWLIQPGVFIFYVMGILSAAFHLANGLWTFAIVWGITVGEKSQRLFSYACAGIGILVFSIGLTAALSFITKN